MFMSRASEVGQCLWLNLIGGVGWKSGGPHEASREKSKYIRKNSIVKLNVQRSSKDPCLQLHRGNLVGHAAASCC